MMLPMSGPPAAKRYKIIQSKNIDKLEVGKNYTMQLQGQFRTASTEVVLGALRDAIRKQWPNTPGKVKFPKISTALGSYVEGGKTKTGFKNITVEIFIAHNPLFTFAFLMSVLWRTLSALVVAGGIKIFFALSTSIDNVAKVVNKTTQSAANFAEQFEKETKGITQTIGVLPILVGGYFVWQATGA